MKLCTKILLLAAFFVMVTSTQSFAQAKDTLKITEAYGPPGKYLNEYINGDTTATGESAHIYLLAPTDEYDTPFFLLEAIRIKNLMLIGKTNPTTKHPPVIAPAVREDGSSPGEFAVAIDNGYVHVKNLYLCGTRTDGSSVTGQCISTADSCRLIVENCVLENFGSTGTPNILNTWNAIGSDIIVRNTIFRNNQSDTPQNPGMNWAGPGVNAIDTMSVKNCTFFVMGGNIEGSGSSMGFLEFDHNTMFMHTKSSPFSMRQMHNAKITNNVFFSCFSAGLDSNHSYNKDVYNANFYSLPAILTLDSLYADLKGDPYFLTEADRNIDATNNAYFWPEKILNNFDEMNADMDTSVGHPRNVGGQIYAPTWLAVRPGAEGILDLPNIKVSEDDNFAMDPAFDATLVDQASDSMAAFVKNVWKNGGSGGGLKPFWHHASSPVFVYKNVPANWHDTQNYPVEENLRYTNATLKTADNGKPLGDLNWFPEIINAIDNKIPNAVPTKLSLSQNYPNPFNPTTEIEYSISKSSVVTLKIFDLLGKEIATLVNKKQAAGQHVVEFDGSKLASGIYLYQIQAGNSIVSKKMVLIK